MKTSEEITVNFAENGAVIRAFEDFDEPHIQVVEDDKKDPEKLERELGSFIMSYILPRVTKSIDTTKYKIKGFRLNVEVEAITKEINE